MKTRRWLLAALALAASTGGAVALHRAGAPARAVLAGAPVSAGARAVGPAVAPPAEGAERRTYGVTLSQRLILGGEVFASTQLEGRISFLPIPGTSLVEARLEDPNLESTGGDRPSDADLRRPVLFAYDGEGRLEGLRFAAGTAEPARLLFTAIAAATQHDRGDGARWSADEEDGTGTYRATYERGGDRMITRHKRGYLRVREGLTPASADGDLEIRLDPSGDVESLHGRESATAQSSAAFGSIRAELQITMRLVDRAGAGARDLADARARAATYEAPQMSMPRGASRDDARRRMDERRAAGHRLEDLRGAFRETSAGSRRDKALGRRRAKLLDTAGAVLRTRPEEARAAGEALAARDVTRDDANFLAGALAAAGTPEAAHALAGALAAPAATDEARRQAAVSLALISVADDTTIGALSDQAANGSDPQVRSMSTLALGAEARTLGGAGGDLDPVADLLARLDAANDDATRGMLLAALGNSGDPRAFDPLRAALDSPTLAPVAAYGLRFIQLPAVDDLLHALTASGEAPQVRLAAYRAAAYRAASIWAPWLTQAAQIEKNPQILAAIQAALAGMGVD